MAIVHVNANNEPIKIEKRIGDMNPTELWEFATKHFQYVSSITILSPVLIVVAHGLGGQYCHTELDRNKYITVYEEEQHGEN